MTDWHIRTTTFLCLSCLWVRFLAPKRCKKVKKIKKLKKNCLKRSLAVFMILPYHAFIPMLPSKELPKIHLAFKQEWQRHEVSVSIRLEHQAISGERPRANGPESISWNNLQRLQCMTGFFSWRGPLVCNVHSKFLQREDGGAGRDASCSVFKRCYHHETSHMFGEKMFLSDLRFFMLYYPGQKNWDRHTSQT